VAESSGEKTEEATPKKLRDAKKKGQVAKSKDLTAAFMFLAGFGVLLSTGGTMSKELKSFMTLALTSFYDIDAFPTVVGGIMKESLVAMGLSVAAPLGAAFVIALLFSYLQVGSMFTMDPLMPKLSKINPIDGFKNMFKLKTFIELIKSTIKLVIAILLAYLVVKASLRDIYLSILAPLPDTIRLVTIILQRIVYRVGGAFLILAVADYAYQKWQFKKDMMMTKDETKREYKAEEGDPQIKGQRKQIHYEMVMQGGVQQVKNADAIVTNPEHLALAIKYDESQMNAPTIVAKGQRLWAEKIIEMAKKHNIPIMRNIPLAHALNKFEVGDEIPEELYEAVAEVLVFVQELKAKAEASNW